MTNNANPLPNFKVPIYRKTTSGIAGATSNAHKHGLESSKLQTFRNISLHGGGDISTPMASNSGGPIYGPLNASINMHKIAQASINAQAQTQHDKVGGQKNRIKKHSKSKKHSKTKKHGKTKKHIKSKKHNKSKTHVKSKKHNKSKKHIKKPNQIRKKHNLKGGSKWLNYAEFHNYIQQNPEIIGRNVLVRPSANGDFQGEGSLEKLVGDASSHGDYDFDFFSDGMSNYYECCLEGEEEEVQFKIVRPEPEGGSKK